VFGREDSRIVTATSDPVYIGTVHSTFQDPNCKLWWDPPARPIVDHYEIKVYGSSSDRDADTNVKRTERTSSNAFAYTYAMNLADFDTPTPDLYFRIKLVDVFERTDEVLTEAHNARPTAPAAPTVTPFFSKLSITWTLLDEPDIIGYNVYIDDVKVAFVQSNNFVYEAEPNTEYRVKVSASDNFQEGPQSSEVTATTFSLQLKDYSLEIPLMKDITWTEHSPTPESVSWSSGHLAYKGEVYEISSGSTSAKYIYWEMGNPTQFQTLNNKPTVGMDSFLIAINDAGALFLATQNKIQHAGILQAGSITAEELATENLITNSAQIAEGVIQDAHIQNLSGDKISAKTITADRFEDTLYGNLNQAVRFTKVVLRDVPGDWEHALTQSDIAGGTYSGIDIGPHSDYYPSLRLDMTRHWDDGSPWWDQSGVYWDHPVVAGGTWTSLSFDSGTEASRVLDVFPHLVTDSPDATFGAQAIYSKDGVNWGTNEDCNDDNWETLTQTTAVEGTETEEAWEGSVLSFRYFKVRFILQTTDTSKRIIVNQPNLVLSSIDIAVASEPEVDDKIEAHRTATDPHGDRAYTDTHESKDTGVHGVGASKVCSEAVADSKIATHKSDPDAHHTKDWQVLAEVEVASDCDYVDFTGLDINRDWEYYLDVIIKNPTGSVSFYYLFVENDYTIANYYIQYILGYGTNLLVSRPNRPEIMALNGGDQSLSNIRIVRDPDGYFRFTVINSKRVGSAVELPLYAGSKTSPVLNITSIRISAEVSGGIGAGSRFILARPRS